jgi:hypothetical protein
MDEKRKMQDARGRRKSPGKRRRVGALQSGYAAKGIRWRDERQKMQNAGYRRDGKGEF